ncbi:GAF and ANTAR domain-containing protein [Nonomuraea jiangxiensis]|uniref:GAF domain-containing protein n=1 Tax=Nonomuraea jiangxiensis TaxID=633440 RepID=A0A1G9NTH7_9ACTN|nr:GAF and ANTAR domain-containing protein [Nonomuraea jiangxiensis]SDL89699.1 GAF domain-containing protein [Nonomuraea jiangxiensis]
MNRPTVPTDIAEFERELVESVSIISRVIPGRPMVSIALCAESGIRTAACSHVRAGRLDELQSATGDGPVLDAISTGRPVTATDLAADSRWRRFAADSRGLRSLHSEPLEFEGGPLGALTLYSDDAGEFPDAVRCSLRVSAGHLELLLRTTLGAARTREMVAQLKEALATRAIIDQALGIVMAQRRCTSHQAFEVLRQVSQSRNVKLHQLAASIVEAVSGEPPQRSRFEEPPSHSADQP